MKRPLVLAWREWREQRALILAFFLLGPLALLAARALFLDERADPLPAQILAPILAGLLAVALCAEMFVPTDGLGRLPTSRFSLWCTKLGCVLVLVPVFLVWLLVCESLRCSWLGLDEAASWLDYRAGAELLLILPVTAGVALFSALLQRPLAAALLGVMLVLGPVAIVARDWEVADHAFLRTVVHTRGLPAFALVNLALVAASLAAYCPAQRAPRARRAGLALFTFALILAPGTAMAWTDFRDRVSITVGDPRLGLHWASASPDGRFVAFEMRRSAPWFESHYRGEPVRAVWIVDVDSGALRELPVGTSLTMPAFLSYGSAWTEEGELLVMAHTGPLHDNDLGRVEWIDPVTGEVLRSSSLEWRSGPLGEAIRTERAARREAEPWFEDEESKFSIHVSPDGALAYRTMSDGLRLVDIATGEHLLVGNWSPVDFEAHGDGRVLLVRHHPDWTYAMLEEGRVRNLQVEAGLRVLALGVGGTLLALRGQELLHLDREGAPRAVLYAPDVSALR